MIKMCVIRIGWDIVMQQRKEKYRKTSSPVTEKFQDLQPASL